MVLGELTDENDLEGIVLQTMAKYGRLDILVNNAGEFLYLRSLYYFLRKCSLRCAGILETGTIETTSMEQYDRVMNVNVRSVYALTRLCVPHLTASKGNIGWSDLTKFLEEFSDEKFMLRIRVQASHLSLLSSECQQCKRVALVRWSSCL